MSVVAAACRSMVRVEAAGRERTDEFRFERARRDHPGNIEGVVGGERHSGMTAGDESARLTLRLIVDRETILRHHANAGPGPYDVEAGQMRKHALRPIRHHGADRMVQHAIVELLFLAVSD